MASSIWQDMLFLQELNTELHRSSNEAAGSEEEMGYKPYQRDPRWLVWLTSVACVLTALTFVGILWWNLRD